LIGLAVARGRSSVNRGRFNDVRDVFLSGTLAGFQNYRPLIFGALLIACMLFMPGGIMSAVAHSRRTP
jgi:ABC-type branched-subunit amino acid transport system permease subunit